MASTEIAGNSRLILLPNPLIASVVSDGVLWREFGHRILDRSKEYCPVGTTGNLKNSLGVRFEHGLDPRILVGSALKVDDAGTNLLGLILLGTEAHVINAIFSTLAFEWHGEQVFFQWVMHPGTRPNPFIQRAMADIVRQVGGIAGFGFGHY
jgi:hypothetical protein